MTHIEEFSEIPVRHDEEKLNFALSEILPFKVSSESCDDPFIKTFLLIQAHMTRSKMPIDD